MSQVLFVLGLILALGCEAASEWELLVRGVDHSYTSVFETLHAVHVADGHPGADLEVSAKSEGAHARRSQRIFLCGVSPVRASSGKTCRHRLNRAGDRQANNALWVIARVRLSHDPSTCAYSERRKTEGLSHREIVRCLKRYLARQLYPILLADLARLT